MINNEMSFIKIISINFTKQLLKKSFHDSYKYMNLYMIICNSNVHILLIFIT